MFWEGFAASANKQKNTQNDPLGFNRCAQSWLTLGIGLLGGFCWGLGGFRRVGEQTKQTQNDQVHSILADRAAPFGQPCHTDALFFCRATLFQPYRRTLCPPSPRGVRGKVRTASFLRTSICWVGSVGVLGGFRRLGKQTKQKPKTTPWVSIGVFNLG